MNLPVIFAHAKLSIFIVGGWVYMTCMTAPEQTCIVQVILEHEEAFNLRQHRRNETMLKKRSTSSTDMNH